uniref:XRE family transcriptional regulator n=1 Tax=Oscillatoriales cyanobacterium SpSt-402 TaxID=2282168 RepID=A0A832H545_9CYAN
MNNGSVKMVKNRHDSQFMNFLLERGKTPEQLASALGKTERAVYYWFSGDREPRFTIKEVQTLCEFLGCSVHEIPTDFGPQKQSAEAN